MLIHRYLEATVKSVCFEAILLQNITVEAAICDLSWVYSCLLPHDCWDTVQ